MYPELRREGGREREMKADRKRGWSGVEWRDGGRGRRRGRGRGRGGEGEGVRETERGKL